MDEESKYNCNNYEPIPIVLTRAKGAYVYDIDSKCYIDCIASYSSLNQGHCHS